MPLKPVHSQISVCHLMNQLWTYLPLYSRASVCVCLYVCVCMYAYMCVCAMCITKWCVWSNGISLIYFNKRGRCIGISISTQLMHLHFPACATHTLSLPPLQQSPRSLSITGRAFLSVNTRVQVGNQWIVPRVLCAVLGCGLWSFGRVYCFPPPSWDRKCTEHLIPFLFSDLSLSLSFSALCVYKSHLGHGVDKACTCIYVHVYVYAVVWY